MQETGADFTNTFRWLVEVPLPEASSGKSNPIALDNSQSSASASEQNGAGPSSSGMLLNALSNGLLASQSFVFGILQSRSWLQWHPSCRTFTPAAGGTAETGGFLEHILGSLASIDELAEAAAPGVPAQQLRVLMQFSHNESLLAALGASKEVSAALECSMLSRLSNL